MFNCTPGAVAVKGPQCRACPECGDQQFGFGGECYCANCTRYVPADGAAGVSPTAPSLSRDEAFEKVRLLMHWWAHRVNRRGPATEEEVFQEACVFFFRKWTPDFPPAHLKALAKFAVLTAVKLLRRQLRGFGCHGFRGHGDDPTPEALIPDRPRHAGLEPDERADLYAALASLAPARRDEVERRFGIGRHREHRPCDLARRFGGGRQAPAERLKRSLARLARHLTPA